MQCCQIGRVRGGFEFDCAGNIGLDGWTKFGLVFGQFGGFQNI